MMDTIIFFLPILLHFLGHIRLIRSFHGQTVSVCLLIEPQA